MKKNVIKTILISLSVVLITTFFCSLKHNLFIDEMISFGLANNKYPDLVLNLLKTNKRKEIIDSLKSIMPNI